MLFVAYAINVHAQNDSSYIGSLKRVLATQKEDTNKVNTLNELSYKWIYDTVKAMEYADSALALSKKLNFLRGEAKANMLMR